MDQYKPKRIEWVNFRDFDRFTVGANLSTESYINDEGTTRDFYLHLGLIFGSLTIVFLRIN